MKKYPVISKSGNRYSVEVRTSLDPIDHKFSHKKVYLSKIVSSFPFIKEEFLLFVKEYKYNTEEFYDSVLAVKNTFATYEGSLEFEINKAAHEDFKKFKKWDGWFR